MIGVQDEDSYGKSGIGKTPQERKRRGGLPSAPRKAKSCTDINSGATSELENYFIEIDRT